MFEFSEGTSNKFWEIWSDGSEVHTRYGKIGTAGQTTVKDEGDDAKAAKLYAKLVAEKTKKGYVEVGGGSSASAAPAKAAPAKAAKAAPAKAAPAKPAPAKKKVEDDEDGDDDGDEGGWRRFEVDEKFWAIKRDGASFTVKYGKIGTSGQEKTKDFGDEDEAEAEYDKLVKEKTKKGYEEV
jgi:predicted DNA-binding WGR domain protein